MLFEFWAAVPKDWFVHLGFLIVAAAFLVRSVLWLRALAIAAYMFFIAFALSPAGGPNWTLLAWYGAFVAINAGHAGWLLHERRLARLTPGERRLLALAFPALEVIPVKRLLRMGRWLTPESGSALTTQGRVSEFVYVLLDGRVRIVVDGQVIAEARPGQFVGEIGFLAGSAATATAVADGDGVRVLAWRQRDLAKRTRRSPELRAVVYAAFGPDLARKLAERSVAPARPREAEETLAPTETRAPASVAATDPVRRVDADQAPQTAVA